MDKGVDGPMRMELTPHEIDALYPHRTQPFHLRTVQLMKEGLKMSCPSDPAQGQMGMKGSIPSGEAEGMKGLFDTPAQLFHLLPPLGDTHPNDPRCSLRRKGAESGEGEGESIHLGEAMIQGIPKRREGCFRYLS